MVVAMPTLLAPAVARLKARAPGATVLIQEGDLTHLLPKLRLGEIDLFVGRLEPGYAAPDLLTEPLYQERMVAVAPPGHPLTRKKAVRWRDLVALPCVLPPPWASLRVKLEQQFHRDQLQPPADLVESASFLAQVTFVRQRQAIGFMAASVAEHFERDGFVQRLALPVDVELPPVGLIVARQRPLTAVSEQLVQCLREEARPRAARKSKATVRG
jgi:DNA-binding transcriptional LysR family regulator